MNKTMMMKTLKLFFGMIAVFILMTLGGCSHEDPETPDPGTEYGDAYYAACASVSSNDSFFSSSDEGGTISFGVEGGAVVVNVDCGTEWVAENHATDLFGAEVNLSAGTLTVTAGWNTVEEDISSTITLKTAYANIEFATLTVLQDSYSKPRISLGTNEWRAPAVGSLSTEIGVESSIGDWAVESVSAEWVTAEKTDSGVGITVTENQDYEERTARIVISSRDDINSDSATITVTQDARASISLSRESLVFFESGDEATVTVESNCDWEYSCDSSDGWLAASSSGNNLTVSVIADNEGEDRTATVTVRAGDGLENVAEIQLTVTERGPQPDALIMVYKVSANAEIRLPLTGTVNCTVAWGDGTEEAVTSALPTHTYEIKDEYKVRVNGTVTALSSESFASNTSPVLTLTSVEQWGRTGLTDMSYAFYCYFALRSLPADTAGSFADVESFEWAFCSLTALSAIPEGIFDYCEKTTNFEYVFANCTIVPSIPEDLFANCPEVTSFAHVFDNCQAVKEIPEGLFAKCGKVTSFCGAFESCKGLTTLPAGLFSNCPKVTDFSLLCNNSDTMETIPEGLFDNCAEVTTFKWVFGWCRAMKMIPSGLFDKCVKVEDFAYAFYFNKMTSIPDGLFDNCPEVTDFSGVFGWCELLTSIPQGLFDHCPKVTNFTSVFQACWVLKSIPDGLFDNCHEVTTFYGAFYNCFALETLPKDLFHNCPKVTDFAFLCNNCTVFNTIPEGLFDNCPEATTFYQAFCFDKNITSIPTGLFSNCTKVSDFTYAFSGLSNVTGESPYDIIEVDGKEVKVHLYERSNYPDYFTNPTDHYECFQSCSGLDDWAAIQSAGWN